MSPFSTAHEPAPDVNLQTLSPLAQKDSKVTYYSVESEQNLVGWIVELDHVRRFFSSLDLGTRPADLMPGGGPHRKTFGIQSGGSPGYWRP